MNINNYTLYLYYEIHSLIMNQDEIYYRNYSQESAETIGILFPDYFCRDPLNDDNNNIISDNELISMFSVQHDYYFDSAIKFPMEIVELKKLAKYISYMDSTTINCVAYCHELNKNICEILKCISKSNIRIRILYVTSIDIDIMKQLNIVKKIDRMFNQTKNKINIRFKKYHTDLNIVNQINKISLKTIKTRIKIDINDIDIKKLAKIFNCDESKIKYSITINIEGKKHKKNIIIPELHNVEYIGLYQKYNKDNKVNKIFFSCPVKYVSLINYCKPIEITHNEIKKLKLLNCHGKGFSLNCISNKHDIHTLIVKHSEYEHFFNVIKNVAGNIKHLFVKNISLCKGYQKLLDINKEKILEHFQVNSLNENKLLSMSQHWKNIINLNRIGRLETVTFKNFPTLIFLNSMLLFSRDVTTVNFMNSYYYMVYESTVTEKILYSYAAFNDNASTAYHIAHHGYDLIKLNVYQKKLTENELKIKQVAPFDTITRFNKCEEEEVIQCYCKAIFTNILQSFLINRNA